MFTGDADRSEHVLDAIQQAQTIEADPIRSAPIALITDRMGADLALNDNADCAVKAIANRLKGRYSHNRMWHTTACLVGLRQPHVSTLFHLGRDLLIGAFVNETRFAPTGISAERCMPGGWCVRLYRDLVSAAAINFIGRGFDREVGALFQLQSDACIRCGA